MKAVVVEKFGGLEEVKLKEVPKPFLQPKEVLIRVHYAGVNPVDWKIGAGLLKEMLPSEFPIILGWDAAGIIEDVGSEVKRFKKGDEVYTYARKPVVHDGTFAEYIALDEAQVAIKPKNSSMAEAASIPLVALTAWQSLFIFAGLQEGDTVLIHAGAGGVGSFAIQLAKWKKAKVYTTASEKNHAYVKSLGADECIDYTTHDFAAVLKEKEPKGVDVVFDCVGGKTLRASFPVLKKDGCIVSIVNSNIEELAKPYDVKAAYVFVSPSHQELTQIAQLIEEGTIKSVHTEEFRLQDAALALQKVKEGHTQGKIVLRVV